MGIANPMRIDRGDVFWIEPDDSRGPVPSYSHPHVVVSDDVFNQILAGLRFQQVSFFER
jgi:mRNA-degrading endonuclease toxin of MazEF toxin-antitoxin module